MVDTEPHIRAVYRPSGYVRWGRLLPGFSLAICVALAMAWCLNYAFQHGFYIVVFAPLFAAFAVGGALFGVLKWSHCRNRTIAVVASIVLGLLIHLGYYYFGMLQIVGVAHAHRVDFLPRYIQFRIKTDLKEEIGRPKPKQVPQNGPNMIDQGFNWFFFGFEQILIIGMLIAIGWTRASHAYCEACRRWMTSETLKLAPGIGASIWQSLQQSHYADVQERLADAIRQTELHCGATIEYCPKCAQDIGCSVVYLTLKDVVAPGTRDALSAKIGALFRPRPTAHLRTVVNHVELYAEEIGAIAASFPDLKKMVATDPTLFPIPQPAANTPETNIVSSDNSGQTWEGRLARIEQVPTGEAGTVLTSRNAILQTVIGVFSTLGVVGVALVPAIVLANMKQPPPEWVSGICLVVMFGGMIFGLIWNLFYARYPTARFMRRQTWRDFEMRANPAVDLQNPDLYFVDIIPRQNWGKMMMENASDIGFLELNKSRRELIFEGDKERYWIPVESIIEIKHEFWADSVKHQLQSSPNLNHVIVVKAMTDKGPWEAFFYRRQNEFQMLTAKRRLTNAKELEQKIRELASKN